MWDTVQGHEQNKKFLAQFLQGDSLSGSLLLYGPRGVGKKSLALAFAQDVLGHKTKELANNPDFILVEQDKPGKNIVLEQIKQLSARAIYAPTVSRYKVCLIDGADNMTGEAANSLLKLLEEPPAYWLFILVAEDVNKLLPTILSRVIRLRFASLAEEVTTTILQRQGIAQAPLLAALANGSPGQAIELDKGDLVAKQEAWVDFLQYLPSPLIQNLLTEQAPWAGRKLAKEEALLWLESLIIVLRDGLVQQVGKPELLLNAELTARLPATCASLPATKIEQAIQTAGNSYRAIAGSAGASGVLEMLVLQLNELWKEK